MLSSSSRHLYSILFVALGILSSVAGQSVYDDLELISPKPTANHINNLRYGNGKFLATVERGIVLSSDDGAEWVAHKTGYWNTVSDIAYGNGIYIATSAGSGPVMVSSDLETWALVNSSDIPSNNDNVFFHDGLFYLGGADFGNGSIATSADGASFTPLETPGESTVRDIGYGNGIFISVGDNLEVMTSVDGQSWTLRATGSTVDGLGQGLLNVRYLNSLFIVGCKAGTLLTSPDGISWTERSFSEDSSWFYSADYEDGTYYFTGRQGKLWSTADWVTWTSVSSTGTQDVYGLERQGGLTVVVGRSGMIITSPDRTVWTDQVERFPSNFSGVVFGANVFVASDYDGNIYKSDDGSEWTQVFTPGGSVSWETIVFEDGKFVTMSSQGEWALSVDGTVWSQPSSGFGNFHSIRNLLFADEKWYVSGRNGFLRSSGNLTDWAIHDVATNDDFYEIAHGAGVFVCVGERGLIYSSENGSDWTLRTSGTDRKLYSVRYGNGIFVVTGLSSTVLTSSDGVTWSAEGQSSPPFLCQNLEFRNGQFSAMDTSGVVRLSSDGKTWKSVQSSATQPIIQTAQSDDRFVVVGFGGLVMAGDLQPKKNLTVTIVGEGTVSVSPEGSPYPHLADVILTAQIGGDFAFSGWSGAASGNANPLTVSMDSDKEITATFVLSVTGFSLWRYTEFNESERADTAATSAEGDFDNDGLTNFEEYLRGFDPTVSNEDVGVEIGTHEVSSKLYLTLSYRRPQGSGDNGQLVQVLETQETWNSGSNYTEQVSVTANDDGTETVLVRATTPLSNSDLILMRLLFSK